MGLPDQMRFARNVTTWTSKMPSFYHGHQAYLDFGRLGFEKRPIYINIVRKPLERLVSYYYFLRFGDDFRPGLRRARQGNLEVSTQSRMISTVVYKNESGHLVSSSLGEKMVVIHYKCLIANNM